MIASSFTHASRIFRKNPGFAFTVILTLSLGIGATTAVFSIVYNRLGRPLPYPHSDWLMALYETRNANDQSRIDQVSPGTFLDWQRRTTAFSAIGAWCGFNYNLTQQGTPERLEGAAASASYFDVLGVKPELGRTFSTEEDRSGAEHVLLLSHHLWQRRFASDPSVLGRTISINGDQYLVIGVMPGQADLPGRDERIELWVPLQQQIRADRMLLHNMRYLSVVGRLRDGVSPQQAQAELNQLSGVIASANTQADVDAAAALMPLHQALVAGSERGLFLCLGIATIVLLIAGANVTNLMLVRIGGRARELAIRMALGASRNQIFGQLLIESLALSLAAGVCGTLLAIWGQRLLTTLLPARADTFRAVQLNLPMLGFALLLSLVTGVLFGLAPAFAASRPEVQDVLRRATSRSSGDRAARRWRNILVVGEIGLAAILLVSTGLLIRSLHALQQAPIGFNPSNLVSMRVALPRIKYQQDTSVVAFSQRVEQQLRSTPGIEDVAVVDHLPLTGSEFGTSFSTERVAAPNEPLPAARLRLVNSQYFSVLSIPLYQGRGFTIADTTDSEPVAIVNQAMSHHFWPNQDVIGRHITTTRVDVTGKYSSHVIVGVVGDIRDSLDEDPQPTMYVPFAQMSFPTMCFIVRTHAVTGTLEQLFQKAVQQVDPDQPVINIATMDEVVVGATEPWKFSLTMMGGLGLLALLLTVIGIFAVISYLVRERTKELGIRLAVGASPNRIMMSVLANGSLLAIGGVALGVASALALTHYLRSMIYGIAENDPATFVAVCLLLLLTAMGACYFPARRAAKIDPLTALREE